MLTPLSEPPHGCPYRKFRFGPAVRVMPPLFCCGQSETTLLIQWTSWICWCRYGVDLQNPRNVSVLVLAAVWADFLYSIFDLSLKKNVHKYFNFTARRSSFFFGRLFILLDPFGFLSFWPCLLSYNNIGVIGDSVVLFYCYVLLSWTHVYDDQIKWKADSP